MSSTYKRKAKFFKYNHVLPILVILKEKGKLNQSQIAKELGISNQQGIVNALTTMLQNGWIDIEYVQPKTTWATLTEKGMIISEKAKELLDAIN